MASQENTSLCFVTWNINGIKKPGKFSRVLELLRSVSADIVFLQEIHVGPDCVKYFEPHCTLENGDETGKQWKVFFTVHSSKRKGVAILIRNSVPFEYICHDEDCSGGYIVLFCRLYGELYTLVNVYNHHKDKIVLTTLKDYLMKTAGGVLVVGGDFNTVLDPSVDRKPSPLKYEPLLKFLKDFTERLNIVDTWSHSPAATGNRFTWVKIYKKRGFQSRQQRCSRIDMFFLPLDKMEKVSEIKVKTTDISDHHPLVLKLLTERNLTNVSPMPKKIEYKTKKRPGKISGAEILSAMQSLPAAEEHRPDTMSMMSYWHSVTETLKTVYNDRIMNQIPSNLKWLEVRYYSILSDILAKRLSAFISFEENSHCVMYSHVIVITIESPQNIKWSFLKKMLRKLVDSYEVKDLKHFAPPPDLSIFLYCLSLNQNVRDIIYLQSDCPLTSAILNLALNQLNVNLHMNLKCKITLCGPKQTVHIHAHQSIWKKVIGLVKAFQVDSGIKLTYTQKQ